MREESSYSRLAKDILMVRPHDFDFNEETGVDNEFQRRPERVANTNVKAMQEFEGMVKRLRDEGVRVHVLEKSPNHWIKTPDAVFPNNWFATKRTGNIFCFPMYAENRRAEKRIEDLENLLVAEGFHIRNLINIGRLGESRLILEGTGSMVIDHDNDLVYAAQSNRCHPVQFQNYLDLCGYKGMMFETRSSNGKPIYHTNVMMSIGDEFAVICSDCIVPDQRRDSVLKRLRQSHDVIEISLEQMEKSFCGNILQVMNQRGERLIVMSRRAYDGFLPLQRRQLERYGKLLPVDIDTIEAVGGGSARCMMAEIFLPRAAEQSMAV